MRHTLDAREFIGAARRHRPSADAIAHAARKYIKAQAAADGRDVMEWLEDRSHPEPVREILGGFAHLARKALRST